MGKRANPHCSTELAEPSPAATSRHGFNLISSSPLQYRPSIGRQCSPRQASADGIVTRGLRQEPLCLATECGIFGSIVPLYIKRPSSYSRRAAIFINAPWYSSRGQLSSAEPYRFTGCSAADQLRLVFDTANWLNHAMLLCALCSACNILPLVLSDLPWYDTSIL